MSVPGRRRREPQPVERGWELAVAVVGGVLILIALAALTGVGMAAALWGRGWVWPHGTDAMSGVITGLLRGDPGRGFAPEQLSRLAGPGATYACIALAEVVLCAGAATGTVLLRRHVLPGDARGGMATRSEAAQALGVQQLRSARSVIRPDKYGTGSRGRR